MWEEDGLEEDELAKDGLEELLEDEPEDELGDELDEELKEAVPGADASACWRTSDRVRGREGDLEPRTSKQQCVSPCRRRLRN